MGLSTISKVLDINREILDTNFEKLYNIKNPYTLNAMVEMRNKFLDNLPFLNSTSQHGLFVIGKGIWTTFLNMKKKEKVWKRQFGEFKPNKSNILWKIEFNFVFFCFLVRFIWEDNLCVWEIETDAELAQRNPPRKRIEAVVDGWKDAECN